MICVRTLVQNCLYVLCHPVERTWKQIIVLVTRAYILKCIFIEKQNSSQFFTYMDNSAIENACFSDAVKKFSATTDSEIRQAVRQKCSNAMKLLKLQFSESKLLSFVTLCISDSFSIVFHAV